MEKEVRVKELGNVDSKYRFVIVASKRAKELLKGAKSRLKSKSRNPIRIAQNEVKLGLVEFEILQGKKEEVPESEDRVFLSEEAVSELEEGAAGGGEAEGPSDEGEAGGEEEVAPGFSEEFEPAEGQEEEKEEEEEEG